VRYGWDVDERSAVEAMIAGYWQKDGVEEAKRQLAVLDDSGSWILGDSHALVRMSRKMMCTLLLLEYVVATCTLGDLVMGSLSPVGVGSAAHRRGDVGAE
jgi:hypothetical protein